MFEKASRIKLRFATQLGSISVEDLWDLPLTSSRAVSLDDIARSLHRAIKESSEESFVVKATADDERLQLAFDIVKHVIDVRLAERDASEQAAVNREKKRKLLELIAEKQEDGLKSKSEDELRAMVEAL